MINLDSTTAKPCRTRIWDESRIESDLVSASAYGDLPVVWEILLRVMERINILFSMHGVFRQSMSQDQARRVTKVSGFAKMGQCIYKDFTCIYK